MRAQGGSETTELEEKSDLHTAIGRLTRTNSHSMILVCVVFNFSFVLDKLNGAGLVGFLDVLDTEGLDEDGGVTLRRCR